MNKFEELLAKYGKTSADVTFSVEGLSDEELEKAFMEAFETENIASEDSTLENNEVSNVQLQVTEDANGQLAINTPKPNFSKMLEISHDDIRSGLYALLTPVEEADNDWYYIEAVYDEYFVYSGVFVPGNLFRQNYSKSDDNVEFVGDRVHLNREYLTDEELDKLNEMRKNYSSISEKLSKYESEPAKQAILESEAYANLAGNEEFEALKKSENHFDLSVEELEAKANGILLEFAKNHSFLSVDGANPSHKKPVLSFAKVSSKYGSLIEDAKELN